MNERIQELLNEAHKQTNGGIYNGHLSEWTEKFAELIVRECVEVCASVAAVRAGYNDPDGRDTAYSCGDQIKEHFGVE
jgi:hypothetical protein